MPGGPAISSPSGSGGGGGAVGRIRINNRNGDASTAGLVVSPAPTTGVIATE
jgi:hypothetical protein